ADDGAAADIARHREDVGVAAVGAQHARVHPRLFIGGEHHGASAIAEEHTGAAVVPIEDAREDFGADHQGFFVNTTPDKAVGGGERIDETAAYRLHVECGAA